MPTPKPNLIFKNAASQWRRHARSATAAPIKIFSPYITGKLTLGLTQGRRHAEVYTLFEAELFIARASDLSKLRALIEAKVDLYLLPGLHAKIVWMPGAFLTIGSQNLTSKGMRNKEATAAFLHQPWLAHVESELDRWIKARKPITLEMVQDMERAIAPFRREHRLMKKRLLDVDKTVQAAEEARERVRQAAERRRQMRQAQSRRSRFERSFRRLHASPEMIATVKRFNTGRVSLVAPHGHSFLRWALDGDTVQLEEFKRYLCVVPELGRLGWARLSNGFITYFSSNVSRKDRNFLGEKCRVKLTAIWGSNDEDHNLSFRVVGHPELGDQTFTIWVSADAIEFTNEKGLGEGILRRKQEIVAEITRHLTVPFVYGQRLTGRKADKFLHAQLGSEFRVRLARLAGHEVLIAEALDRP